MFKHDSRIGSLMLAAALVMGLAACEGAGTLSSSDGSSMSVHLTDAPAGDLDKAWVEIERITLQGEGGGVDLLTESTDLVELTQLAGTTQELVSDVAVPPGTYTQLRIIVGAAAVETEDGDVFSKDGAADDLGKTATGQLICPSCPQTGIKVNLPEGGITLESDSKILVLDFDVSQSFGRQAGRSGRWVMNPLIRTSELEASGTVSGSVSLADGVSIPDCGGSARDVSEFVPLALDPASGETVKSGSTDSEGSYAIEFLEPGDYDLGHESEVAFDGESLVFEANASPSEVTVESGSEVSADYTITSATCESDGSS